MNGAGGSQAIPLQSLCGLPLTPARRNVDYTLYIWDGLCQGKKTMQPWELVAAVSTTVGACALAGRCGVRAWGRYQLGVLARESQALQRWWAVIGELPVELLSQPLRNTVGRVLYQRLKRARRVQPDHPFLRVQILQIARFINRGARDQGWRLTGVTREKTVAAFAELHRLLDESAAERLISSTDLARCEASVAQALTQLEFAHYRQAALQAEFLRRTPQAIQYLRTAVRTASALGRDCREVREVEARLRTLEASSRAVGGSGISAATVA